MMKNGVCWVEQVWDFDELLRKKRKQWTKNAIAVTGLAITILYDRGFVCGEVNSLGDGTDPIGFPALNNVSCCEFDDFDADGNCAEGNTELFNRVSCADTERGGTPEKPTCTPQYGTYQLWGAPHGSFPLARVTI